jgi:hypothetical protein
VERKKFNISSILITTLSAVLILGVFFTVVGQGIFASRVLTAELVAETKAEFEHQLEVINTGKPNKPFPYSKYADDWARHSVDLSRANTYESRAVANQRWTPLTVDVSLISRSDFFAEPKIKAVIVYHNYDCINWRKSDKTCLEWGTEESGEGNRFEISFWEVDGKWRIKDIIVNEERRFFAESFLNWRCWSIKTGWDNCPAYYRD